ncbi:MAG TPA: hypothetical protein DCP02_06865 [Actinobacteria bacterium]|nr:hypothetical protein [Actinomycetota bacterium]
MILELITREKLEYTARKILGYSMQDAEKDYFLALVMQIISNSELGKLLVFKGGTSIYHCYLEQLRFSEDLDFTSLDKNISLGSFSGLFNNQEIFEIKKEYESYATIKIERLKYNGILEMPNSLKIEVDKFQNVYLPSIEKYYKNNWELTFKVNVMDPVEICAEKIRAANDRFRYRDFYDLYMLVNKYGIDLSESIKIISKKEIRKPISKFNIVRNLNYTFEGKKDRVDVIIYKEEISNEKMKAFIEDLNIPDFNINV